MFRGLCQVAAIVLHGIEKFSPAAAEAVGQLGGHAAGEAFAIMGFGLPFGDVLAAALYEVSCQFLAQWIFGPVMPLQLHKTGVEQ